MDIHRSQGLIHECQWRPADFHGYPWISLDIHRLPCISMDYLWIPGFVFVTKWHPAWVARILTKPISLIGAHRCEFRGFQFDHFFSFYVVVFIFKYMFGANVEQQGLFLGQLGLQRPILGRSMSKWLFKKFIIQDTHTLHVFHVTDVGEICLIPAKSFGLLALKTSDLPAPRPLFLRQSFNYTLDHHQNKIPTKDVVTSSFRAPSVVCTRCGTKQGLIKWLNCFCRKWFNQVTAALKTPSEIVCVRMAVSQIAFVSFNNKIGAW